MFANYTEHHIFTQLYQDTVMELDEALDNSVYEALYVMRRLCPQFHMNDSEVKALAASYESVKELN
jgi:hypothetical protein